MATAKRILINVLMFILVWYLSQAVAGLVIGVGISIAGVELNETVILLVAYAGIITSIVSEIIFWRSRKKREEA